MTKTFFIIMTFLISVTLSAQNDSTKAKVLSDSFAVQKQGKEAVSDTNKTMLKTISRANPCDVGCSEVIGSEKWLLVFSPLILFVLLGVILTYLILNGKFELSEALSTIQRTGTTTEMVSETVTVATETTKPVGSTSRLIAFFTGVTAIIVAICLLTYYAYFTIAECKGPPHFEGMWKILLGLGIGVVPYGVNVWRGTKKEGEN